LELLKEDAIISADITVIQYVDLDKSVVTWATLESFLIEKCTTDDQCEPDSVQPSPIISTSSSCFQAIKSIHQLMQSEDDEACPTRGPHAAQLKCYLITF